MPRGSAGWLAGFALVEAVDLRAAACVELALDPRQAHVDAAPAGGNQVDEQREVVDPRVPLGREVVLEPFEPPDRLPGEPPHLGELPADGSRFHADALADGFLDPPGKRRLELRSKLGKRFYLCPRALQSGFDVALSGPAPGCALQALARPCNGHLVHGRDASVRVG